MKGSILRKNIQLMDMIIHIQVKFNELGLKERFDGGYE